VDGRKFRTIFPRLDIKIFQQVLVAKAPIGRGTLINQADVALERTSTAGMVQAPLTRIEAVLGAEATREIRPGTVLTASMFRLPNVIKAGDMVNIVYTNGDLTIVYQGQARTAGAIGQLVRVMNMESKREFTARVTGPNQVEIKVEE
jgi:flagella basal body P-ring formation protein FlgA